MVVNLRNPTDLSGFYIVYEGSTNIEKKGWYGISHLMEHLMCKTFDHLRDDFEKEGVDWNAYTTNNEIVFYFTGLDEKVNKWKHKILELMGDFTITKEQFENERNIVLEEYMDSFNQQVDSHSLNLDRKLFNDYGPIGLKEDLENLKFLDCLNFFELQYSKPSKIINVSSKNKFSSKDIEFSDLKITKKLSYGNHKVPFEINNEFKDKTSLIMLSPVINEDNDIVHFINSMLSSGLSSPLYQEVREKKGLVYYISCYQSRSNNQGITSISTLTSNKNVNELVDTVKYVLENPDKFLTKERFETTKESYIVNKKKSNINRYSNVSKWISPDGWSVTDIVDTLTLSKVRKVYDKYYKFNKFYISNDKDEFKNKKK
jgi:predicted Zn-dependent peptidase